MNIYVGNLPYSVEENKLKELFQRFGEVQDTRIVRDRMSGQSKGFGFVEMESEEAGNSAIESLNGSELDGRKLVVNKARPKTEERGPRRDSRY